MTTAITLENVNMSIRGRQALTLGLMPFFFWTIQAIKKNVIQIKLSNKPCPSIHFDSLDDIPLEILAKYLLKRNGWHHVCFLPRWFYEIDEQAVISLTMADIRNMQQEAKELQEIQNKPRLARFTIHKWKVSTTGHEFCDTYTVYGVLYNGTAFFENGNSKTVIKDECEVQKLYTKVPKTRKSQYDLIRRKMRAYNIFC